MRLAELFVEITGKDGNLNRTLVNVRGNLAGLAGTANHSLSGLNAVFLGLAGSAARAGAAFAAAGAAASGVGLFKAFEAASELNATISKTKIIFGDAADSVVKEADRMSAAFGSSKTEYINAAASFGAVFKGMGKSQKDAAALGNQLAKLGMDMASFEGAGTTDKDAFTAISSALRGEMDPIERFRVFLNADKIEAYALANGLAKSKTEMTDAAKKSAVMALILKQTADAQGDLARTANESDNQYKKLTGGFKNVATTVGTRLMPVFERLLGVGNRTLDGLGQALTGNQERWSGFVSFVMRAMDAAGKVFDDFRGLASRAFASIAAGLGGSEGDFSAWAAAGKSYLGLVSAAYGAFLETANDVVTGVGAGLGSMREYFNGFMTAVSGYYDTLSVVLRNWKDVVSIVGLDVGESVTNMGERFAYLGEVVVAFGGWFTANFSTIFKDAFNAVIAAATNFGSNLSAIIAAIYESAKSGFSMPIEFRLKPLDEGFKPETPEFKVPEMKPLTDFSQDRQRLLDNIAGRELARQQEKAAQGAAAAKGQDAAAKKDKAAPDAEKPAKERKAQTLGLEQFAKHIQEGLYGKDDSSKKTAENTGKVVGLLERANDLAAKAAVKGGGPGYATGPA